MLVSEKTSNFLKIASQFQLGHLITESFHPLTTHLSQIVGKDISKALTLLQEVDQLALESMQDKTDVLWELAQEIQKTLMEGHKVFLCGCGATGRLSLVLETLHRQKFGSTEQVISFMAGGDYALIKSVEAFEDRTDFGSRQLMELGFGPHDLLLASSEGGETPFVIGACLEAAKVSSRSPYFLYCNSDELLMPIQRSREIIEHSKVKKINLTVGPMAISGSTRMQASTVLMLAIGVGLLHSHQDKKSFAGFYTDFLNRMLKTPYEKMANLTRIESRLYQEKKFLNYLADPSLAISILTDTTERSPTFSLPGFKNRQDVGENHSLSYLFINNAKDSSDAWESLLARAPRALEWSELAGKINKEKILGFDISVQGHELRKNTLPTESFTITHKDGLIKFSCLEESQSFDWGSDPLFIHLMVKMLLNAHSTSVMGRLGRYEGNVMTWVRPSNNKLIDRAARYVLQLLNQKGKSSTYEKVVEKIFEEVEVPKDNEPVVLNVVNRL